MAAFQGALALLLLAPLQVPRPPTFTVGVENVSVDVLVTRGGRLVEELRAGDFALRDNDVPQQVEVLERSTTSVDAVYAGLLLTDPRRGRPLVVVFSDGVDRGSWLTPEEALATARASDAVVQYVEIEGARAFLEPLAEATGGRGWSARRPDALRGAFVEALEEFKSRYRLRYEPSGVPRAGWTGDPHAARGFVEAGIPLPRDPCHGREECEAAAVLNLDAAALLLAAAQDARAEALVDTTRVLVNRQTAAFAFDWLLAAGYLHQAYADHARAFGLYAAALELRPGDPSALLARATALEFFVLPDGFGAVVVADRDVWRLLEPGTEPPGELAYQLANPRSEAPYRRLLLEFVTRQYRNVLELDAAWTEARLTRPD